MLDSLPSLTALPPPPAARRPSADTAAALSRMECRHTISAKLGSAVPLAVRRALGMAMDMILSNMIRNAIISKLSDVFVNLDPRISSVSDLDWIRIQSGQWIRIRIKKGKNDPQKIEKSPEFSCF
jgi:hypothetical protein